MANIPRCHLISKDKDKKLLGELRQFAKESHDAGVEFSAYICKDEKSSLFLGPVKKGEQTSVMGVYSCPANRGEVNPPGDDGEYRERVYAKLHSHPSDVKGFFSVGDVARKSMWYYPEDQPPDCVIQGNTMICHQFGLGDGNVSVNQINLQEQRCSRRAYDMGLDFFETGEEFSKCLHDGITEAIADVPSSYEFLLGNTCEVDLGAGFDVAKKSSVEKGWDNKWHWMRSRL